MTEATDVYRLQIVSQHSWIKPGEVDVRLPPIATICGANGTGKSTLLAGIGAGSAAILGANGRISKTKLFSIGELANLTQDSGYYDPTDSPTQFDNYSQRLATSQEAYGNMVQSGEPPRSDEQRKADFESYLISSGIVSRQALAKILRGSGHDVFGLTREDFQLYGPLYAVADPFSMSLSQAFVRYADIQEDNAFRLWRRDAHGEDVPALSDDQFRTQHGPPPWDLMNTALQAIQLPYHVDPPPAHGKINRDRYECRFLTEDESSIRVEALSSGERTLLALVLSTYQRDRAALTSSFPEVLLLDEADASLHPSYILKFFRLLREILWKQVGVRSILTTHSPSTAVLSDEGSTFEMVRSVPRLIPVDRDRAVASLSAGVPTLAVRLENQLQVIVESKNDTAVYQVYFAALRDLLDTEKSLAFLAVGAKGDTGGKSAVKSWVKQLRSAGSSTAFGLVDRDAASINAPHIFSVKDRYTIENIVLDPPQLGAFLLRSGEVSPEELCLPADLAYYEIDSSNAQQVADGVTFALGLDGARVSVNYVGGFDLQIPEPFLEMPGHHLETLVAARFPSTRHPSNSQKVFLHKIVASVANDSSHLIPASLVEVFEEILDS